MPINFEESIVYGDWEELKKLKHDLFQEYINLSIKQIELEDTRKKFIEERAAFQTEMKEINLKVVSERQRLKDEEAFFEKRYEILKNGFDELNQDRKRFERDKYVFEQDMSRRLNEVREAKSSENVTASLFMGVTNYLALKKRYRDLMKIFHPDNLHDDGAMAALITKEYESLKAKFEYGFKVT